MCGPLWRRQKHQKLGLSQKDLRDFPLPQRLVCLNLGESICYWEVCAYAADNLTLFTKGDSSCLWPWQRTVKGCLNPTLLSTQICVSLLWYSFFRINYSNKHIMIIPINIIIMYLSIEYIYIYHIYTYILYTHMHVHICVCTYVCVYMYVHVYMCMYIYVCVYIFPYTRELL